MNVSPTSTVTDAGVSIGARFDPDLGASTGELAIRADDVADAARRARTDSDELARLLSTLVQWIADGTDDPTRVEVRLLDAIDGLLADIDARLAPLADAILDSPGFRDVEGAWRGLADLLERAPLSDRVRIDGLCLTRDELDAMVAEHAGAERWRDSTLYKVVYEERAGMPGGIPYGLIIHDGQFGPGATDGKAIEFIGRIANVAFAPAILNASPACLGLESWSELTETSSRPAEILSGAEFDGFRSLRDREWARFVSLAMPRVMARLPWGPERPCRGFDFVEGASRGDDAEPAFTYAPASMAFGANVAVAADRYEWCARICGYEGGGRLRDLPAPLEDRGGTIERRATTEVALSKQYDLELANEGFLPLLHWAGSCDAVFVAAPTLHVPREMMDDADTARDHLASNLPYLLTSSRVGHLLRRMAYEKVGSVKDAEELQDWLTRWIKRYVWHGSKKGVSVERLAEQPLDSAMVTVTPTGKAGHYRLEIQLRPMYLVEQIKGEIKLTDEIH